MKESIVLPKFWNIFKILFLQRQETLPLEVILYLWLNPHKTAIIVLDVLSYQYERVLAQSLSILQKRKPIVQ